MTDWRKLAASATLLSPWCNVYGGEGSNVKNLGGLGDEPDVKWYCKNRSSGRFRMECEHGHRGQIMPLCEDHYRQYRNSVEWCPRCNIPDTGSDHRCRLTLEHVS